MHGAVHNSQNHQSDDAACRYIVYTVTADACLTAIFHDCQRCARSPRNRPDRSTACSARSEAQPHQAS
jgi:hypothetical protein